MNRAAETVNRRKRNFPCCNLSVSSIFPPSTPILELKGQGSRGTKTSGSTRSGPLSSLSNARVLPFELCRSYHKTEAPSAIYNDDLLGFDAPSNCLANQRWLRIFYCSSTLNAVRAKNMKRHRRAIETVRETSAVLSLRQFEMDIDTLARNFSRNFAFA